ncbi:DEAD/DEAH box helicase [Arsenicicoccus dermatophilus]|uniref:DEAD/DEAH box helicase n=1 Tax=Arsenicicoccus dermatophilus TaxID=1076331 RepID=UPI001F4D023D|nr:DEAD/DEAH box helicase [Arsenicicoccus dermatophilus]MCH8613942.1 DEAD/DEAH box helicase [Arsenicicoccus dermatophilus]
MPATPDPATGRPFEPGRALAELTRGSRLERLRHVETLPDRAARTAPWPTWVHPRLRAAWEGAGVTEPWTHQVSAAELAWAGRHTVLATGTASGKSYGYLMPALTAVLDGLGARSGRGATVLYLSPTKALAADQLARLSALQLPGLRATTYDGDTPADERRWIRQHAHYVLTNPDLVHHSLLPQHERWASFLRSLRYVVVDECHVYRGVFGAHLAALLRRLRRVCARYCATPTFVLASATVAEPAAHAQRLTGLPCEAVTDDGSPRAAMSFALWEPPLLDEHGDVVSPEDLADGSIAASRRSTLTEGADLLARLVDEGVQTVAFARSRKGVEVLAETARGIRHGDGGRVAAYRGGYLPEERRDLERALRSRSVVGLAATNALELGIDVSGLDAVLLCGWPGTFASLWQQAGRAGRSGREALAVLVADDDPLDTYLVTHPEAIFSRPVEATVVDPDNPYVLAPHLAAAAAELPLTQADEAVFGPSTGPLLQTLTQRGILRRRPNGGWYWARSDRAHDHVSLRGSGEAVVRIVERRTGAVLGTVDHTAAQRQVHAGAVYVHQGRSYVVTELDLDDACALVVAGDPGWTTTARTESAFDLLAEERHEQLGADLRLAFGSVAVRSRVTSFLRRLPSGEVLGEHPLELPESRLHTRGVWWTMTEDWLDRHGIDATVVPGATHAAEHAAIGMLPLVATADRWDVGGVSTPLHPDTGLPTILVYDGHQGGAGFAERGYERATTWLRSTADAIRACGCQAGCPSCVQSPKCGNGNEPLDKAGALRLLDGLVHEMITGSPDVAPPPFRLP